MSGSVADLRHLTSFDVLNRRLCEDLLPDREGWAQAEPPEKASEKNSGKDGAKRFQSGTAVGEVEADGLKSRTIGREIWAGNASPVTALLARGLP